MTVSINDTQRNNALLLCCVSHFIYYFAECHYAECHYAECRNAECRYAECRGAFETISDKLKFDFTAKIDY